MKPKILILPDGAEGFEEYHYSGLFDGGYSSLGPVRTMSLAAAIEFYLKVLKFDNARA